MNSVIEVLKENSTYLWQDTVVAMITNLLTLHFMTWKSPMLKPRFIYGCERCGCHHLELKWQAIGVCNVSLNLQSGSLVPLNHLKFKGSLRLKMWGAFHRIRTTDAFRSGWEVFQEKVGHVALPHFFKFVISEACISGLYWDKTERSRNCFDHGGRKRLAIIMCQSL